MTPFKVACEHCDASFKINDSSRIGKRVKCPRCGEAFTIPKPAEDEEEEFDEPPVKPSRRMPGKAAKAGGGRARKVEKKEKPSAVMWIGGGVGFVVGLVVMLWLTGFFSSGPAAAPVAQPAALPPAGPSIALILDRLPRETEVVMHFRVKDALASPLIAGLRTPEFDAQLASPNPLIPGTTVSGLETITVAMSNFTHQLSEQKRLALSSPPKPGTSPFPEPLILVTLNDPLTPEFLNFPPESAIKHGGTTIYRRPQPLPFAPPCLAILDPKVVALGSEQQLKALVDQPSGNGATGDFQLLDGKSHVAVAICPRTIIQQAERLAINNVELPQLHRELHQLVKKGGKAIAVQFSMTSDVEAGVSVQAADASKLADVQAAFEAQFLQKMREGVSAPGAASDPILTGLKPVIDGMKVTSTGDRVSATAVLSKDTVMGFGQMGMTMAGPAMMNFTPPPAGATAAPAAAP
jgi:predicted Zn finger-like uncharacterized protein